MPGDRDLTALNFQSMHSEFLNISLRTPSSVEDSTPNYNWDYNNGPFSVDLIFICRNTLGRSLRLIRFVLINNNKWDF